MKPRRLARTLTALSFAVALPTQGAPLAAERSAQTGTRTDSIDSLARDVDRLESVRAVKTLQRLYAQYGQYGLWQDMADLFADQGRILWGDQRIEGRWAIADWLKGRSGGARADARNGLRPGALDTELIEEPLVNLSADGMSAKARWMSLSFLGDGKGQARIEGGLYENLYVREGGRWKMAEAHYYPQYEGGYAEGWANVGRKDLPVIPTHFTPDEAGAPIPPASGPAPRSGVGLPALQTRIAALNDEDAVRNVQNAYGYYVDRKMWDDVVDLFARDGTMQIGDSAAMRGRAGLRKALVQEMGPAGLHHGELNDRPLFDTVVRVLPGGREAESRGIELGMLGEADKSEARWRISVFRNRFVKEGGVWKLKAMRLYPLMTADYHLGWGSGGIDGPKRPALPAFLGPNPGTGKPVAAEGETVVGQSTAAQAAAGAWGGSTSSLPDARRRYQRSAAFDGAENISAAYGFYIDDGHWPEMGAIFGRRGAKEAPFAGFYRGANRIAGYGLAQYGAPPTTRAGISFHWLIQPVILVSHDGRSANVRTRLFQPRTAKIPGDPPSFLGASLYAGMYQNQAVLEDGVWRLWNLALDEPYFTSAGWKGGWAGVKDAPPQDNPPPSPILKKYPPDVPITAVGRREEHFRGGVGQIIQWPSIQPMWFPYRNLVSGRTPENFIADCAVCTYAPDFSMTRDGYEAPPTGPQIDGVNLALKAKP